MRRKFFIVLLLSLLSYAAVSQEDGLNLPTELYILLNEGRVERYGLGVAGVEAITDDDTFVIDFAVAPDNNWLAYRTEEGLNLRFTPADDDVPVLIESSETADFPPARGDGPTIVWSPDASALAYTTSRGVRVAFDAATELAFSVVEVGILRGLYWSPDGTYLAAEADDDVWWVFKREGLTMVLVAAIPATRGAAWLSDVWLVFAPPEGGLRLMDLSAANEQIILQDESNFYALPAVTVDGDIRAFTRAADDADTPEGFYYHQRLGIDGSAIFVEETSEVPVQITGDARWDPQGTLLVSVNAGGLSLLLPMTGQRFPLPIEDVVAYDWGPPRPSVVTGATLVSDGFFLARDESGIMQVWRLPRDGSPRVRVTTATDDVTEFRLPEVVGGEMAYISAGQLFSQPLTGGEAVVLYDLPPDASDVSFSTDGGTIAYATPDEGEDSPGGVWFAPLSGDVEPQRVLISNGETTVYAQPRFAPTSDALLARLEVDGAVSTVMLDPATGEVVMLGGYGTAQWLDDGRVLAYSGERPGELYLIDPAVRPIQPQLVLQAGARIYDVTVIDEMRVQAVTATDSLLGAAPVILFEAPLTSGEGVPVASVGFLTAPVVAPGQVAGLTRPDGTIMIFDVPTNEHQIIEGLIEVHGFTWSMFR